MTERQARPRIGPRVRFALLTALLVLRAWPTVYTYLLFVRYSILCWTLIFRPIMSPRRRSVLRSSIKHHEFMTLDSATQ